MGAVLWVSFGLFVGVSLVFDLGLIPSDGSVATASGFTAGQLEVIQEVITLVIFAGFAVVYLGETLKWNHLAAFVCLIAAVGFMFSDRF